MKVANTIPKSGWLPLVSCKTNRLLTPKVARNFDRLPSTNAAMLRAIEHGEELPAGSVYLTRDQTDGRGQGSNRWYSSPGANLTFSLLLRPDHLSVDRIFVLTQVASLAVCDAVGDSLPDAEIRIKWPNDVYVGDRKLAGILIQNGLRGQRVTWSVIGTGLNVNEATFPPELQASATSLLLQTGVRLRCGDVLEQYLHHVTRWYERLEEGSYAAIHRAYQERLYRRGESVTFLELDADRRFVATVRGTDAMGRLQLTHVDGTAHAYELRSLRWLL